MSLWGWILLASAIAFGTKLSGYFAPAALVDSPAMHRASASVTVGLLASLVVTNAFSSGQQLLLDARVAALGAAAVALMLRAPFLLVVIVGAAAAALARLAGLA